MIIDAIEDDDLFAPAGHRQPPVTQQADIPRSEPPILGENLLVQLRLMHQSYCPYWELCVTKS